MGRPARRGAAPELIFTAPVGSSKATTAAGNAVSPAVARLGGAAGGDENDLGGTANGERPVAVDGGCWLKPLHLPPRSIGADGEERNAGGSNFTSGADPTVEADTWATVGQIACTDCLDPYEATPDGNGDRGRRSGNVVAMEGTGAGDAAGGVVRGTGYDEVARARGAGAVAVTGRGPVTVVPKQ